MDSAAGFAFPSVYDFWCRIIFGIKEFSTKKNATVNNSIEQSNSDEKHRRQDKQKVTPEKLLEFFAYFASLCNQ